jgi:hypothetical protein
MLMGSAVGATHDGPAVCSCDLMRNVIRENKCRKEV